MSDISWAVVTHESRLPYATTLAATLDAEIALDDGTLGCDTNHLRAWQLTTTTDAEWCAVVEDDAVPVHGFTDQAVQALAAAPTRIVSFYLGTGRPERWQYSIDRSLIAADHASAHWLTCSHLLHAVAVAIHTSLVDDWLDWGQGSTRPIDERITGWCATRGHRVAYTSPSLVDHRDAPTLIPPNSLRRGDKPRRAWRTGTRRTWNTTSVDLH